ncbi:phage tail protein [Enterobacter roggenkampii]|uniref:phage tail protein n=1 Tax=Enterobacter roggenkampii TaxID=1812935 RepID=UPI002FD4F140
MAEDKVYSILTNRGAELEAEAIATNTPVILNKFVVGDANGAASVIPDPSQTSLIHELYRGSIQAVSCEDNHITFQLYIPPEVGGYTIKEIGILTNNGELYSVGRSPDIIKPNGSNGAVVAITFKYTLAVSSTDSVSVVIYDEYITPKEGDARYLKIAENLSEIKSKGKPAQTAARENIGIDGDIAYRDQGNTFQYENKFKEDISFIEDNVYLNWPTNRLSACGLMFGGGLSDGAGLFVYPNNEAQVQSTYRVALRVPNVDKAFIRDAGDNYYKIWNEGNLTPVRKVNNISPDANGNVTIAGGIRGVQLGSEIYLNRNDSDGSHRPPRGYVLTGAHSNYNDSNWELDHVYAAPVQVTSDGNNWVTISAL